MPLLKKLASQKWSTPAQEYRRVGDEASDDFDADTQQPITTRAKASSIARGVIVALLLAGCFFGLVWWPSRLVSGATTHHQHLPSLTEGVDRLESVRHCGNSVEEALKLGCSWDYLANSWLPQRCIDQELSDEFEATGDWHFYEDRNGTKELTVDELKYRVGPNMTYFTSLKWHRTHCSYQWRKMHRAMKSGGRIENSLADYEHTLHCGWVFLQDGALDDLLTEISVEFCYC